MSTTNGSVGHQHPPGPLTGIRGIDYDHPVLGRSKWLQTPVAYSENTVSTKKMAPAHGEDTESVLIELLDYTWDDIATLQEERVIL